ncbi:MAG: DUF692 family protein [Alphaproteobacteria bacterium]|nr:DUF692 family protein [Alphaproteobacteria bacterium]
MENPVFPKLGFGLGFRPAHFSYIEEHAPPIDWFEIISENYMESEGRARTMLESIMERYPVVMHGVSLSIGTLDPINSDYLKSLKKLIGFVQPPWISDHLCWTGIAHKNTHDLLPVPYTEEALKHIVSRIRQVQEILERPIVLENPSTYLEFTCSAMTEWDFIAAMADESGCGLLLDVNNIYVSCYNHRWDPKTYIDAMPLDRVAQIHLAGHTNKGTHIVDTHDDHVIDEVWTMYRYVIERAGRPVSTMIEWDDNIPDFPIVMEELEKARKWASAKEGPTEMPSFKSFRDNIRPSEHVTPLAEEMEDMQGAILSGQGEAMKPDLRIVPKPDFAPEEQIGVYITGYRLRLFDIVHQDYPALRERLGEKEFARLLDAYIEATPSTSYNAARYCERFPAFIKEHGPDPFAHELAVLETEISRMFDAPESPVLSLEDLAGLTPESFMDLTLKARKALKLFAFSYPVNAYFQAVMDEHHPAEPQAAPSYLALYRHEDEIWRLDLEEREFMVLSGLFAGLPVGEALAAVLPENSEENEEILLNVQNWFSRWMGNGLLAKVA